MGYTTVGNVAGMFPNFARGSAQQKPSDDLIQTYVDDVAAEINAILVRRGEVAPGLGASGIAGTLSADAANICEMINRYGAAAQLGETLGSFGVASTRDLAKTLRDSYERLKNDLDARDDRGQPRSGGPYDKYFNPQARTETAEPGLKAISGGDQPAQQTPADTGSSQVFGKFDKRGR
jgi:hypothetical protein